MAWCLLVAAVVFSTAVVSYKIGRSIGRGALQKTHQADHCHGKCVFAQTAKAVLQRFDQESRQHAGCCVMARPIYTCLSGRYWHASPTCEQLLHSTQPVRRWEPCECCVVDPNRHPFSLVPHPITNMTLQEEYRWLMDEWGPEVRYGHQFS